MFGWGFSVHGPYQVLFSFFLFPFLFLTDFDEWLEGLQEMPLRYDIRAFISIIQYTKLKYR